MKIVGLTGGIGSGKSTVANMFRDLGVPVYDSDREAKELMVTSEKLRNAIIDLLGPESYKEGNLNRPFIASKVFLGQDLLMALNAIVHPAVREHFQDWAKAQEAPYVIQETALIFENGMQDQFDHVILVSAPWEIRLERVIRRDQVEEQEVLNRMDNQMEDGLKEKLAHFSIVNLDLEDTRQHVQKLHETLVKQAD
ncbi:dephospho-CoA kinase [Flagellimonas myxillae]|uniref:dephospho-CoA kinase n=1 Tax=Flagellimonas myxillae TaxID=2942214 RepID=UPI00201F1250|nr:dephospho-CoA kinase [Muricauda myxillae]MCL6265674.1 dephospho-CoA kinase [Muricauda myxillae]